MTAVFGKPGYYVADLIPTREGDYVWTFMGTINDDAVNETFDAADGKIDGVQAISALEFPLTPPDAAQQSEALSSAETGAQIDRTLALVGIGVGVLAVLGVVGVWLTRRVQAMTRSRTGTISGQVQTRSDILTHETPRRVRRTSVGGSVHTSAPQRCGLAPQNWSTPCLSAIQGRARSARV